MKLSLKKVISYMFLFASLVFLCYYIYEHFDDFKSLKLIKPVNFIYLLFLFLITTVNNGLTIKYILIPFQIRLSFKEWFGLSTVTSMYNMIFPFKGGFAVKGFYLKKTYNFTYANFLSVVAGIYILNFFIAGLSGLICSFLVYFTYRIYSISVILFFLILTLVFTLIIIFSPKLDIKSNKIINKIVEVINGWHTLRQNKKYVFMFLFLISFQLFINALAIYVSFPIFGIKIDLIKSLYIASISIVGLIVQITPSGLGVNEALSIFAGMIVGMTPAQSLSVSILNRIFGMVINFSIGPIYTFILFRKKKSSPQKNISSG